MAGLVVSCLLNEAQCYIRQNLFREAVTSCEHVLQVPLDTAAITTTTSHHCLSLLTRCHHPLSPHAGPFQSATGVSRRGQGILPPCDGLHGPS